MNTPRTDALLNELESFEDAVDWATCPTEGQFNSVVMLCKEIENELVNLKTDNLKD